MEDVSPSPSPKPNLSHPMVPVDDATPSPKPDLSHPMVTSPAQPSAPYLLRMRPRGVVSKKAMGARSRQPSRSSWKTRAARRPASEKQRRVRRMVTAEPQQKMA